jgi:ADP-ribose pyrophosphatase YjhB (NUDIX family)
MTQRRAEFCPLCGTALEERERYGRQRPVCPACDHTVFFDPKVAVVVLVTRTNSRAEREILLIKRANEPGKGRWALPAGFVEYDEHPSDAAIRETIEETGVVIEIDTLVTLFHRPDTGGLADIVIAYTAHPVDGVVNAADDADDAAWFSENALPEIVLVSTQALVARWQRGDL